jgi:Holliday junction resolvase RusA-like endonuclease
MKGSGKVRHPIRVLTKDGQKFKNETTALLVRNFPTELKIFKPDTPYCVVGRLYFPDLLNKGWPDKAKTKYKRIDADNRLKLFLDVLKDAAGVDDSAFLDVCAQKYEGPDRTEILVWNMEEECPPLRMF